MCDCLLSTRIEIELFDSNRNNIPNDDCPICLIPLKENAYLSCCGGYAKKLKCGHYVHVSCQINKNTDLIRCPICRQQLTNVVLYYKINQSKIINKLPLQYQRKFLQKIELSDEEINDLLTIGINYKKICYSD